MDTEFGLLPWLLLFTIAVLIGHSIAGKYWKALSRVGVFAISIAIAISFSYTAEQIGVEGFIFYSQVTCFLVFLCASCVVLLKTIFEIIRPVRETLKQNV